LLKLVGTINQGKTGDINFNEIDSFVEKKEAFSFVRNISSLKIQETELDLKESVENVEQLEEKIIEEYFGRVNSRTDGVSIARMKSPQGWVEPGQQPEFAEYTVVFEWLFKCQN